MTFKQNRRALGDIRHHKRKQEQQKYLSKPKPQSNAEGERATVAGVFGSECLVLINNEYLRCRPFPDIAVGDEVLVKQAAVQAILPRRTVLSRPDPTNSHLERVLAANVDLVIVVGCVGSPPLRPGVIDRIAIAATRGGADVLLCVNKCDLGVSDGDRAALATYTGIDTFYCSCATGEGLQELRSAIAGRTCVFAGHSGVGKSSLVNALCPGTEQSTGEVGKKGRHTTSSSHLIVEPDGTRLIDTPGIREFGLWKVEPGELRAYFPEFAAFPCGFRDCTHIHETSCAVRDAGLARYPAYLRIWRTIADL